LAKDISHVARSAAVSSKGDTMATASPIRRAVAGDVEHAADILSAASENDPFVAWMFPESQSRRRRVRQIFLLFVLSRFQVDRHCYIADHGAAVWVAPGAWKMSTWQELQAIPGLARTAGRSLPRALYGGAVLEQHHPEEPLHWYLEAMGVAPGYQGRGIGSRLVEPMLERCDAESWPAYLETANARNLGLYERLGFRVSEDFQLRRGPRMWTMWREPMTGR
jgi:GNAT superfamily N-acetyltransferase